MNILDTFLIIAIHVLCFYAGMKISDRYHDNAERDRKEALERQYLRLRAKADADDPCRPYVSYNAPRVPISPPIAQQINSMFTGDTDGDDLRPITPEFMDHLRQNGQAATKFNKADITK